MANAALFFVSVNSPLLDSLAAAVAAAPDELPLRLHLAELRLDADRGPEAVGHLAQVLVRQPANESAQALMARAIGAAAAPHPPAAMPPATATPSPTVETPGAGAGTSG